MNLWTRTYYFCRARPNHQHCTHNLVACCSPIRHNLFMKLDIIKASKSNTAVEVDEGVENNELVDSRPSPVQNKSRLREDHRNILNGLKPYSEPKAEHHLTLRYERKMFGLYGNNSGVNPAISWPLKADIQERKEYEQVAFPFTIQELVKNAECEKQERELEISRQHERVLANMTKLEVWKTELKQRIAKKEAEAVAARQKKEKLVEEVRRHFGFTVDPKDDRFKEMLAVKEKEQKKKEKQAKMEERERQAISKLMSKHGAMPTE